MCAIVAPMRAAQALTRPRSAAMDRTPPPRIRARARALVLLLAAPLACATPPETGAASQTRASEPPPAPTAPVRTANNDARGAGMQPDYDGEAALLREQMLTRLPTPLPSDRRAACSAMLDAAAGFYGEIEPEAAPRAQLLADLKSTHASDLAQCERETSVRAATCVQLRLGDRDAELPWLLDQCSRAFPD